MTINKVIFLLLISCCFLQSNCMKRKGENIDTENNDSNKKMLIGVNSRNEYGETKLMLASKHGDLVQVMYLINDCDADPNICDYYNSSPLLKNIIYMQKNNKNNIDDNVNRLKIAEYLIKNRANINCQNNYFTNPLMQAISQEQYQMVELLLKYGADYNLLNPLKHAFMVGNVPILEQIIRLHIKDYVLDNTNLPKPLSLIISSFYSLNNKDFEIINKAYVR